jgi:hypothetical protein
LPIKKLSLFGIFKNGGLRLDHSQTF